MHVKFHWCYSRKQESCDVVCAIRYYTYCMYIYLIGNFPNPKAIGNIRAS